MKTKLEKSELLVQEKTHELQNYEMRLKCAEEQIGELEKRNEIFVHSNTANEVQLRLVQEDLHVLRKKLEKKNVTLESREKVIKELEEKLEVTEKCYRNSNQVKKQPLIRTILQSVIEY